MCCIHDHRFICFNCPNNYKSVKCKICLNATTVKKEIDFFTFENTNTNICEECKEKIIFNKSHKVCYCGTTCKKKIFHTHKRKHAKYYMWIIKMKFEGEDKKCIVKEEKAKDDQFADVIYQRMLHNLYHEICKDVLVSDDVLNNPHKSNILLKTIQFQLSLLGNGSTFEISKERNKNLF